MWKPAYNLTRSPQPPTTPRIRKNMRNNWRALAERRAAQGLTTRGTIPVRRLEQRLLLADLDALAAELATAFDHLPRLVQAKVLCLEVRRQIL